jgi:hypothetical protein
MTDSDWSAVSPGGRNAILSWLRLGGQLVIYHSGSSTLGTLGIPADSSYGIVDLQTIGSDRKLDAVETIKLVDSKNPILTRSAATMNNYSGKWPLQALFGPQDFNYGVFIAVLILFGILVGPINLFLLAKSGQRHRLFITTPLISLGASVLLVGIIIFQDGFGGNRQRKQIGRGLAWLYHASGAQHQNHKAQQHAAVAESVQVLDVVDLGTGYADFHHSASIYSTRSTSHTCRASSHRTTGSLFLRSITHNRVRLPTRLNSGNVST